MKTNVCGLDRIARISIGFCLIAWSIMDGPQWAWVGVLPLVTGLLGVCPIYSLVGPTKSCIYR